MNQSSDRDREPHGQLAVFLFGCFFMAIGLSALLLGFGSTPTDLRACSSARLHDATTLLYWLNVAAGLSYLGQFAWWWWRRKRPWESPNPVAFSRQPWAGRTAWRQAAYSLLDDWRSGQLPAARAGVLFANAATALIVALTSAVLAGQLAFCDACPAGFDGSCAESIGAIAGACFLMIIYYDLRIKFSAEG